MTTRCRIASLILPLVIAGCSSPTYLEDLKTPVLIWERDRGLCGSAVAVDGNGQLWIDHGGCEDGRPALDSGGHGAPDKVDALRQAFDALPEDSGPDRGACGGNLDSFSKRSEAASFDSRACDSGTGADVTGLQEPYLTVAMKFLALP